MNTCRSRHALHSNVRRSTSCASVGSISLIEVSPPHAGHSPRAPMGADWGACMLCPFPLELSASPWKVQVRLGLNVNRLTNRVCAILTTSPTLELKTISPAHSTREQGWGWAYRCHAQPKRERDRVSAVISGVAVSADAGARLVAELSNDKPRRNAQIAIR